MRRGSARADRGRATRRPRRASPHGPARSPARGRPHRPPRCPPTGRSPGSEWAWGCAWSLAGRSHARGHRGGGCPAPAGSRSIPCSSSSCSRSRVLLGPALRTGAQDLVARVPGPHRLAACPELAVRAVRFHPTSVASGPGAHPDRPSRPAEEPSACQSPTPSAPARPSDPACPTCTGSPRSQAPASPSAWTRDARRSPSRSCSRTRSATPAAASCARRTWRPWRPGARAPAARPRSRSCPAASSSRTSPACRRSWTSPRCATRWRPSAAIPPRVNPLVPADLVIDHSVQIDAWGGSGAFAFNVGREYERNGERYQLLRWAQTAFRDLRVVPPGTGHHPPGQPRVPRLGRRGPRGRGRPRRLPGHARRDGLPHHDDQRARASWATASAASRPRPSSWASRSTSRCRGSSASASAASCPRTATATDLVLVITEMLRKFGVVGAFVEFAGDGLAGLSLADRATISNMSPEFGATTTLFPIDDETLAYLRLTGRPAARVDLVERYAKEQGLWREPGDGPEFDARLELDLATVEPSPGRPAPAAGPCRAGRRPATTSGPRTRTPWGSRRKAVEARGETAEIGHGSVAIAAITSCTNTSNPTVMVGAGLLARNAVARGLRSSPIVKTSLAPGSRAVTGYLERAGLMAPLGGPRVRPGRLRLHDVHRQQRPARRAGRRGDRGRRAGRRGRALGQPQLRGAHPPARPGRVPRLAAAGRRLRARRARGHRPHHASRWAPASDGSPVMLADIWPSPDEVRAVMAASIDPELFRRDLRHRLRGRRAVALDRDPRRATATTGRRRRRTSPTRRSSRA